MSRRKKLLVLSGTAILVIALAVLLSGCVQISNVNLNSGSDAGSNHQISMTFAAQQDAILEGHGVFAVRIPVAWDVKSVTFTGAFAGPVIRSTVMEGVFATDWEAAEVDDGYNGPKPGYKWWAGYSQSSGWLKAGDTTTVTILIDTHGRGGTYMLDFVVGGTATLDNPEDVGGKGTWYAGSYTTPKGALLDQAITLYAFTDVHPGADYFDAIQGMAAKGLIEGYPTSGGYSEFRPNNSVFRAQYSKMIVGALGLAVTEGMASPVNFTDLGTNDPANLYPHEYVWAAYNNQIIKGYTDGTFRPYTVISRGHVVTMTVRALQRLHPSVLTSPPPGYMQTWGNDLLPEHMANAAIAEYNNLLSGLPLSTTASNANAGMPRGEVAQVLWNMMNLITGP